MMIYLMELTYYDATSFQPVTLGFSSGDMGYCPLPSDNAPVPWYEPRLKVPADYQCSIFRDGLMGGSSDGGYGTAQLLNHDGFFDQFLTQAWDGHQLRLLYGDDGDGGNTYGSYENFNVLLTGTMCEPDFLWNFMNLKVRDYTEYFDQALSQFNYLGNNVGGVGVQGTPSDLMGKSLPLCFGRCYNVTPEWVSQAGLIYQVHNGPIKAVDMVFSNADPLPLDCSVNGTVESATASYVSSLSFSLAGVNRTAVYTPGLLLTITQTGGLVGNLAVVSSSYTGGNTVVTLETPPGLIDYNFALTSGVAVTRVAYGGGDCATLAALQAAVPQSGMFCTCLALGLFATSGGAASTAITAHVRGDATGGVYVNTVADIIERIATNYVQRPRKNYLPFSEAFTSVGWASSGFTLTPNPAGITPPVSGMGLAQLSGAAGSSFGVTLPLGTGMYCLSWAVQGTGSVNLEISDPNTTGNNCQATFNLATGAYSNVQANGQAVGPQYQATGFITAAGVIQEPNGFWRIWLAGQPNSTFSSLKIQITSNDGSTIVIGGAQVEAYSSPAAYTGPTTGTAAGTDGVGAYYAIGYDPSTGPSLNAAAFAAFKAAAPYEVGYAQMAGDASTAADVMNALCESVGGWWGFDRSGNMICGQYNKPSAAATPVQTFSPWYILQDSFERSAPNDSKDGAPAYQVVMQCVPNWTPQAQSTVAEGLWTANPNWVAWVAQQWRQAQAENMNVRYLHPLACVLNFTAYLAQQADAVTECARLLALYSQHLDRFTFTTKMDFVVGIVIGSIINITIPRFQLNSGRNFMVVSITESHETGHCTLGVLG
jgi:hypothetical protein